MTTMQHPEDIRDVIRELCDRASDASAEVYELCDDSDSADADAAYALAEATQDLSMEAIDICRELRLLQWSTDARSGAQIDRLHARLAYLLTIATEHADEVDAILTARTAR